MTCLTCNLPFEPPADRPYLMCCQPCIAAWHKKRDNFTPAEAAEYRAELASGEADESYAEILATGDYEAISDYVPF